MPVKTAEQGNSDTFVCGRYRLDKFLGASSSGEVYLGTNVENKQQVAIKLESVHAKKLQLFWEVKMYKALQGPGIPTMHWHGVEHENNVMVLDVLGPSLRQLHSHCDHNFSLKTVLLLADQMIAMMEDIHGRGLVHRALKPETFLIGLGKDADRVFLSDFGAMKFYRNVVTMRHIPFVEGKKLKGAARYCSLNAHRGFEMGRRDDMEALGYVLLFLLRGNLPWSHCQADKKEDKFAQIFEMKKDTSIEVLTRQHPTEFVTFFRHVRSLPFEGRPDYTLLRRLFSDLAYRERIEYDKKFDWSESPDYEGKNRKQDARTHRRSIAFIPEAPKQPEWR